MCKDAEILDQSPALSEPQNEDELTSKSSSKSSTAALGGILEDLESALDVDMVIRREEERKERKERKERRGE